MRVCASITSALAALAPSKRAPVTSTVSISSVIFVYASAFVCAFASHAANATTAAIYKRRLNELPRVNK